MEISLRLYDGILYIPTSYRVKRVGGFFTGTPLEAVPVEQAERLKQAILTAIGRGNPPISREEYRNLLNRKDHPLLKATGVQSWFVLDRGTNGLWGIAEEGGLYKIRVKRPMESHGWHEDRDKAVQFPAGTPVEEVIARLIAMIQQRASE